MHGIFRFVTRSLLIAGLCTIMFITRGSSQSKPVTLDELTREAEVVAVGQVKDMTSEWDDSGARIRTRVVLAVDQFIKGGTPGSTLTLYVPGGEVGTVGEIYSHMPVFKKDEQVMVFAAQDNMHHYRVTAGEQGKFTVQKDQATGEAIVPGHATLQAFTNEVKNAVTRLQSGEQPNH